MYTFLSILYVLVCLFLILVVLLQPGRGGIGGAFGGGSSQTVFGSSGAGNFLTRLTSVSAALFMILSATLAYLSSSSDKSLERAIEAQRAKQAAKAKDETNDKAKGKGDKPAAADESMSEGSGAPIELAPEPGPTGAAPAGDAPLNAQPAAPAAPVEAPKAPEPKPAPVRAAKKPAPAASAAPEPASAPAAPPAEAPAP
jgi:preprotein translocase subunit SecG